jgi:hypothetical protein
MCLYGMVLRHRVNYPRLSYTTLSVYNLLRTEIRQDNHEWKDAVVARSKYSIMLVFREGSQEHPGKTQSGCNVYSNPSKTRKRFTSFRLYEMHKSIPVFQFTSQFSLIRAPSSRKSIVVPRASINFRFSSFRLTSSFGGPN